MKPVDVQGLVTDMSIMPLRTFGSSIGIAKTLPLEVPLIVPDAHHLTQALLDLFVNALSAMPGDAIITD